MTKWAKRMVRERELEQQREMLPLVVRRMYRGKRWLAEFATGIRLVELAWSERVRYSRLGG